MAPWPTMAWFQGRKGMTNAESVRRVIGFEANGYPVVSLYLGIPHDSGHQSDLRTRVGNLLHQIRPLATDPSLRRAARMSIGTDLKRIEAALDRDRWRPGAIAVFACAGRNLFEEIALPARYATGSRLTPRRGYGR